VTAAVVDRLQRWQQGGKAEKKGKRKKEERQGILVNCTAQPLKCDAVRWS
jgi:hypothetical protein